MVYGDMDATKSLKVIWFGDIHGPEPYEFIGLRATIILHTQPTAYNSPAFASGYPLGATSPQRPACPPLPPVATSQALAKCVFLTDRKGDRNH
jgi:hypothetical protein